MDCLKGCIKTAASGKGLQEGATEYDRQDKFKQGERKLDIERMKAEKQAKTAAERNAFDKQFADQYGNLWFYDADNKTQPVMVTGPDGKKVIWVQKEPKQIAARPWVRPVLSEFSTGKRAVRIFQNAFKASLGVK